MSCQRANRRTSKERGACAAPTSSSLLDIDAVDPPGQKASSWFQLVVQLLLFNPVMFQSVVFESVVLQLNLKLADQPTDQYAKQTLVNDTEYSETSKASRQPQVLSMMVVDDGRTALKCNSNAWCMR